jgi:hypothetical protein
VLAATGSFILLFCIELKTAKEKTWEFFFFFFWQRKKEKKKGGGSLRAYPLPSFAEQHASDSLLSCLFYLVTSVPKKNTHQALKNYFKKLF